MPTMDDINEAMRAAGIPPRETAPAWTRELVAERFAAWRAETGEWPTSVDLNPSLSARRGHASRAALHARLSMPYPTTVYSLFKNVAAARAYAARRHPSKES